MSAQNTAGNDHIIALALSTLPVHTTRTVPTQTLSLKERERVARPAVMHPQHLNRERKSKQTRTNQPNHAF